MPDLYPPLKERPLPKAPPLWKAFGVGTVVLALGIGSGELILWPHLATKHGLSILWGATVGVIMQYFINLEVTRNALATGESFFMSSARVLKWVMPFWLVSAFFLYMWPGWAGAMGATLQALIGWGSTRLWAWVSLAFVLSFVVAGRVAYAMMERVVKVITIVFFALLLTVSAVNLNFAVLGEALRGLVNFGWFPSTINVSTFLGAVVFAGAGGLLNLCLSFWYRDKQAGMGAYVGQIKNPLTSKPLAIAVTGSTFTATAENLSRWRQWLRIVYVDQGLIFAFFSMLGLLLMSLNAYTVLSPLGLAPEGIDIIRAQAHIFGSLWGSKGSFVFLAMVFMQLFSTLWVVLDAFTRIVGDIVYTNAQAGPFQKYFAWARRFSAHSIYYVLFILLIAINAILIPFGQPFVFLILSAVLGGAVMAIYTPILLYLNNAKLPRAIRPSLITNLALAGTTIFYTYFTVRIVLGYLQ